MTLKQGDLLTIKLGYLLKELDYRISHRESKTETFAKHVERRLDESIEQYCTLINDTFEKLTGLAKTKYNLKLVKNINRRIK